jgi:hypothetical protein
VTDRTLLEETLLALAAEHGPGGSFSPTDAAIRLAGNRADQWGPLMQPLRRVAVALAKAGRLVIYRKGKPADPDDFKGLYRLGLPRQD